MRTFLSLQVKSQAAEGLGGEAEAGGGPAGPRGPNAGGAAATGIAENCGVLLAAAFARLWARVGGREFLEPQGLRGAVGGGGGAAFGAGELARPWARGGDPRTVPRWAPGRSWGCSVHAAGTSAFGAGCVTSPVTSFTQKNVSRGFPCLK